MGKVNQAWETLRNALESKRLIIAYRPGDARELGESIRALSEKYGDEMGAVFVDYMQTIPVPEGTAISSSYQKVQAASAFMRDAAVKSNIPIICGAQLNRASAKKDNEQKEFSLSNVLRPEFLREAGDLEQDANLILGIYAAEAGLKESDEDTIAPFSMLILKNRNGRTAKYINLKLTPSLWRLDDEPEEEEPDVSPVYEKWGIKERTNDEQFQRDHAAGYDMDLSTGKRWMGGEMNP